MSESSDPLSAIQKILDSELVKNLFGPATKHVGEGLGIVADLTGFYMTQNLARIFTKWARHREARLDAEEFQRVMPLLPNASMASEDELQEKWATLMESAVTNSDFLRSFGQTLSQLSVEEARFLDTLWEIVMAPRDFLSIRHPGRSPISHSNMVRNFDPTINSGVNRAEFEVFNHRMTMEQKENYRRYEHAELVIDDLVRLGLLSAEPVLHPNRFERSGVTPVPQYSFSEYGVSFMQAVTRIKKETEPPKTANAT
jgi:hypothetical protein